MKNWLKNIKRFVKIVISFNNWQGSVKMFKTVLNKNAGEKMKVPANLLKHLLASKPFYQQGKFFMILKQFLQN